MATPYEAPPEYDYRELILKEGDLLLLASDGLAMLDEAAISACITGDLEMAATSLFRAAVAAGSDDNISLILVSPVGATFGGRWRNASPVADKPGERASEKAINQNNSMKMADLKSWLRAYKSLFARELRIVKQTEDIVIFRHQGLTDSIKTKIQLNGEIDIIVEYEGECWDIVKTFEVYPARLPYGAFYCKECEQPEYYDSELSLWEHHSLREWAAWMNTIGTPTYEIRLGGGREQGFTSAFIVQSGEAHRDDELVHTILPITADNGADRLC